MQAVSPMLQGDCKGSVQAVMQPRRALVAKRKLWEIKVGRRGFLPTSGEEGRWAYMALSWDISLVQSVCQAVCCRWGRPLSTVSKFLWKGVSVVKGERDREKENSTESPEGQSASGSCDKAPTQQLDPAVDPSSNIYRLTLRGGISFTLPVSWSLFVSPYSFTSAVQTFLSLPTSISHTAASPLWSYFTS